MKHLALLARLGMCAALSCGLGCTHNVELYERAGPGAGGTGGADSQPLQLTEPPKREISARFWHTCALDHAKLWCWGRNEPTSLNLGSAAYAARPVEVKVTGTPVSLGTGWGTTCALTDSGLLWCWGQNDQGQLGQGDSQVHVAPVQIMLPEPVRHFDLGHAHVCAITESRALWCWGWNKEHQLGLNEQTPAGLTHLSPQRMPGAQAWHSVSTGDGHTCALTTQGELYCWGRNSSLQCGVGAGTAGQMHAPVRVGGAAHFTQLASAQESSCALDPEGAIWCWGLNTWGQMGRVGTQAGVPTLAMKRKGWLRVDANTFGTCANGVSGDLWCWGFNEWGDFGVGDRLPRPEPTLIEPGVVWHSTAVGWQHSCGRRQDDSLWCAGRGAEGQLGDGTTDISVTWRRVAMP